MSVKMVFTLIGHSHNEHPKNRAEAREHVEVRQTFTVSAPNKDACIRRAERTAHNMGMEIALDVQDMEASDGGEQ